MGFTFSLTLSREITDKESASLQESGCASAVFTTDSHPTKPDITVTKLDFDDTASPSLAEAIEAALESVKVVPDLTVPALTVPAQPATAEDAKAPAEEATAPEPEAADKQAADKQAAASGQAGGELIRAGSRAHRPEGPA
ncbi:MAG: hypothetical protein J2P26_02180 [Nocardiopsaceae bacterium]|nr:hypothetical protein [Nocardiopsaceae bacterium]